jgi:hypothetical protein
VRLPTLDRIELRFESLRKLSAKQDNNSNKPVTELTISSADPHCKIGRIRKGKPEGGTFANTSGEERILQERRVRGASSNLVAPTQI